jgi:hypothetical protein
VAGALHEAGRRDDAVELYRSVAIAYRDQGRPQQAITVCRSILELAPGDASCRQLLEMLLASQPAPRASPPPAPRESPFPVPALRRSPAPRPSPPRLPRPPSSESEEPPRRSSVDVTPLPLPLPYHEADPTTGSLVRLSASDLPPSLREELAAYPEIAGIAAAARQISASLIAASRNEAERDAEREAERDAGTQELGDDDLAADLDTGRLLRTGPRMAPSASVPPPLGTPSPSLRAASPSLRAASPSLRAASPSLRATAPRVGADAAGANDATVDDDEPTLPPPIAAVPQARGDGDDDKTEPRDLPTRVRPPSIAPPTTATGPLAGAFFAPLPPRNRPAVLQRFRRRMVAPGTTVIRRGETGHGLVIVVRGRLDLHAERADGVRIGLGAIVPGEFTGEASLLARGPATTTAIAGLDSELLVLAAEDFHDVTSAFPALRAELEAVGARRTRDHEARLRA